VVLTADLGWSDVGEWSAVLGLRSRNGNGNSLRGRAAVIDSSLHEAGVPIAGDRRDWP
jgi:mannose-1-phosphate guanylyltransferase / mannose-6-phosphate isomerase